MSRHKVRKVRERKALRYARSYLDHVDDPKFSIGWAAEARLGGDLPAAYRAQFRRCPYCRTLRQHAPQDCPVKRAKVDYWRPRDTMFAAWLEGSFDTPPPPIDLSTPLTVVSLPPLEIPHATHLFGGMSGSGKTFAMQTTARPFPIVVEDEAQQVLDALPAVDLAELARTARKPGIFLCERVSCRRPVTADDDLVETPEGPIYHRACWEDMLDRL